MTNKKPVFKPIKIEGNIFNLIDNTRNLIKMKRDYSELKEFNRMVCGAYVYDIDKVIADYVNVDDLYSNWGVRLPNLYESYENRIVNLYTNVGEVKELTIENKKRIRKLERKYPTLKVVGVLNGVYEFSNGTSMELIDYLLLDESRETSINPYSNVVRFLSYTCNTTDFTLSEIREIGVIEYLGLPKRVY